ncbi:hypothetical protein L7F22_010879 [Adiantum nelumboides]|nr:hypothetical protein [Adiantum nelumboides]
MADNNKENRTSIDDFDFAHEDANDDTSMLVNYLVTRLHQAMGNPALQGEVQQQLHAYGILPPIQQERGPERFQGETSKRGLSTEKGVENPYQELKQLLEGKPSSKKKGHAQPERSPSREREESESSDESMENVAPRRRRDQRSPLLPSGRGLLIVLTVVSPKEKRRTPKRRRRERGHPLLPPHHPLPLRMKVADILLKKDKGEDTEGHMLLGKDKALAFIQQFDAAFGDEGFMESSKLGHVAMHFQKSARQWWASLRANGEAPKTWKALRASIMKQFLASDAKDKVLTEWRSLKLSPYESIHKYVDKFWDLHLKATVYKKIDFEEQKQQFCAGLPEDMNEYVNSQRPRSISAVIHNTMVAARINFQQGAKRNLKPMEAKEKQEYKGKNFLKILPKETPTVTKPKRREFSKVKTGLLPKSLNVIARKTSALSVESKGTLCQFL